MLKGNMLLALCLPVTFLQIATSAPFGSSVDGSLPKLTGHQKQEIRQLFNQYDINKNGIATIQEQVQYMRSQNVKHSTITEFRKELETYFPAGKTEYSLDDFMMYFRKKNKSGDYKFTFSQQDDNGDNKVDMQECHHLANVNFPEQDWQVVCNKLLAKYDKDGDSAFNYDEFVDAAKEMV